MRLIQVRVPADDRDAVLGILDDEDIDYVVTPETSDGDESTLLEFPLPTQAVDAVLSDLRDAGLDDDGYTVVENVETARTPNIDELEERFVTGDDEDERVASEEIRTKALGLNPGPLPYYAMTLLSAVVATAGLLLDSPALVVGSMVIAPQVGSAMTVSAGFVLNDRDMITDGLRSQVLGLGLAIVGAAAVGWTLKTATFIPPALDVATIKQISQRISPGLLSFVVGVCAGAAGAFGIATALPVSLVGVMIAAALIPAAAAVGVGLAWGPPGVALGAFVLLVINTVAVNVAGSGVLWYLGYRPEDGPNGSDRLRDATTVLVAALVLLAAFAGAGMLTVQQVQTENAVNEAVQGVVEQERYDELELVDVQVEFDDMGLLDESQHVTVVVSRPADESYPSVAAAIGNRVARRIDGKTVVEVEFTERQRHVART